MQEGVQIAGIVESPYIRQGGRLADLGPWLQLPDDLQFFIKGVLVKAGERHQMLILLRGLWQGLFGAFFHDIRPSPYQDGLAHFRRCHHVRVLSFFLGGNRQ